MGCYYNGEKMELQQHGIYIVKDEFFKRFYDATWIYNKNESRPFYYSFPDTDGIYWLIPMTSKVEKIKGKIKRFEDKFGAGNCVYYEVGVVNGKEAGFKISDIFPITEEYIEREYKFKGRHVVIETKSLNESLERKAKTYLNMVKRGSIRTGKDVFSLRAMLRNGKE